MHPDSIARAIAWLFPEEARSSIRGVLTPFDPRLQWALLSLSHGDRMELDLLVHEARVDYRNVLMWAESQSCMGSHRPPYRLDERDRSRRHLAGTPAAKESLLLPLPPADELAFQPLRDEIEHLGFFDRGVWFEAMARKRRRVGPTASDRPVVEELFRIAFEWQASRVTWTDLEEPEAERILLHIFSRTFLPAEVERASRLLDEIQQFIKPPRRYMAPAELRLPEIGPDFRLERTGGGSSSYQKAVAIANDARVGIVWLSHG
jgi:hypothetical protein